MFSFIKRSIYLGNPCAEQVALHIICIISSLSLVTPETMKIMPVSSWSTKLLFKNSKFSITKHTLRKNFKITKGKHF